ncbi:Calx-beta domain-containing protein [Mycolicibacterium poriferae]|uniref:Calx-beta domain-containing protein n=1 Tax=Mycolicibacterium poriferae TaxID=39694 RepID=UPI0024BB244C|nr:Calx-beta domain-containing protein [Mycolicibacterium poriferae]
MATADPSDESSTSGAGPDNATTGPAKTGAAAEASTDPDASNSDVSDTDPAGAGDAAPDDAEQDEVDAADAVADELDEMTGEEAADSEAVTAEEAEGVLTGGAADTAGSDDDPADPDGAPVEVGAEGQVSPGVDLNSAVGDVESNGAAAADPTAGSAGSGYGSQPAEEAPESEPDTQAAAELQAEPAPTDAAVGSDDGQPATAARSTATALRQQSAPDTTTVVDTHDASADLAPQSATTGLAGLVSKFLGLLGIGPSASDTGVPLPSFEFVTAVFGAIRREMDRLFSNDGPSAAPALTGQAGPGVLTGSLGATDPEGDPLRYSVVQAPGQGAVTVDADGDFVYTAGPDLAAAGGTDTFVVRVRDTGFRLLSAGPRTTEVSVTVTVSAAEAGSAETSAAAVPTAMLLVAAQGTSTGSGSVYQVSASGPDIVGFDPAKDKLDLGDVSVHNFIVVDTAEGVGFRNPWSGETAIIQGVSLGQLTVDSFTPIINDHLRQDLSGALAWEHGVTAAPGTVYARSHEIGQIDRVAFDAATDVVDFRYYGTREQLYMTDTPEGVVISNAGTGQALILQGVTTAQLTATNFIFHNAQVREDRLHLQLGIGTVPNSQVLPQGVPIAGTDNWPTAAGNGAPPSGQTGTTTTIAWQYGTHTTLDFDPAADTLDFGWFKAHEFTVDEVSGSTRIAIVNNNQSYTLTGVGLGELQMSNIVALDDTARAKWQTLISNAAPPVSRPTVSVGDASAAEGDSDSTTLTFTVTLSEPAGEPVTVSYSTANGTATAAGADYTPTVGTLTFAAGETVKTVNVAVTGDTMVELDEQFTLNLSAPVNAVIGDGVGVATIVNDDVDTAPSTPPAVSIADLTVAEGDGEHSHFMFTVTLDKASDETVTVQYSTSDGTAIAGVDYTATTGTVTFAPGVTTQLVHVDVIGDAAAEQHETFTVTLSSPVGATLADGSATGTITDDDTVTTVPGLNSGNPGDELWGEAFYAPYVDMGLWPVPDLVAIAQGRGASLVTLGFLQATPDGKLAWAGLSALAPDSDFEQAQAINSSIAALQAAGGDVMISLGGASGTSLAQWYATRGLSARSLADAYVAVAQTYSLNRIDFDIEGSAVADAASIALRSQALALMQQDLPDLEVWYTLPVLPTGLTADGLNVVRSAVSAGVKLDGVNVMAMDYGESAAPTSGPNAKTMGAYAIQAAESTYAQLAALYGEFGQSFGWNQVGVTPMIGVNDVTTEVFTVADAQALEDFARAKGLGMLSMWSVARDTPGSLGQASPTASGLDLPAGSFSAVFNDYGTANDVGDALPTLSISDAAVVEGDGGQTHVMFTVTLSAASDEAVSVGYVTSNGTATAGVDYTAASGVVTFAPGVTSQMVHVMVAGDAAVEGDETFTVSLSNPSGATIADGSAVGTITNDDVAPTPTPGASSVTYVVSDDWGSGFVAGVKVTAGSAFDGWTVEFDTPARISNIWNAEIVSHVGQHYVVRNASWNAKVAAGQSVEFGFQAAPGGGSSAVTGFVVNGSSTGGPAPVVPKVSVADASVVEGDSGTTQLTFTVTLDTASDEVVSVGYVTSNGTATAGVDYTAGNGTITFAPGVLSQQISVTVTGDGTAETDETFTLTLSSPSGATIADGAATGTILNDDVINPANLMLSISDASVVEGAPGSGVAPGWFSTSGNQIVDSAGNPVQIAGINWFGMESDIFTPHGLWTRNYQDMMDQMVALEFNTIRLPYSSEMLHTTKMPSGIDFYRNPELAGLTPIEIMDEVIRYAGEVGLRVILDHHRSSAGAGATANGLWYEGQYTEAQWIADWQMLAARYAGDPTVIGADLHNEPHNGTWGGGGATDWAAAAERAGNAILAVNDNWLIFVEGVASYEGQHYWWGGNLMGVADRPIVLDVADRVVYSPHDYPNSVYAQPWFQGADFGDALPDKFEQMWGYIYEQNIAPIYLGEFGTRLSDPKDVVWYEAITSYLSGDFDNDGTIDIAAGTQDMSWTFWSWNPNSTDTGGILADDWNTVNENKLVYLEALQFDFDEDTSGVLANFVVTLAQPSNQTVTVQYATSNGTATGGDDYVATTGTLTFAPGETSKTISVVVLGDTVAEGSESFLVTLSSPTGATVGDGTGTGTITDATVV